MLPAARQARLREVISRCSRSNATRVARPAPAVVPSTLKPLCPSCRSTTVSPSEERVLGGQGGDRLGDARQLGREVCAMTTPLPSFRAISRYLPRVMRVPGSLHLKGEPQSITMGVRSAKHYSLDELREELRLAAFLDAPIVRKTSATAGSAGSAFDLLPKRSGPPAQNQIGGGLETINLDTGPALAHP